MDQYNKSLWLYLQLSCNIYHLSVWWWCVSFNGERRQFLSSYLLIYFFLILLCFSDMIRSRGIAWLCIVVPFCLVYQFIDKESIVITCSNSISTIPNLTVFKFFKLFIMPSYLLLFFITNDIDLCCL